MSSSRDHAPSTCAASEVVGAATADILEAAAKLIEPDGAWVQGFYRIGSGSHCHAFCLIGALSEASGMPPARVEEDALGLISALYAAVPEMELDRPFRWNDARGRKQQHVVSALRKAAKLARAKPTQEAAPPASQAPGMHQKDASQ